MPTNITGWLLRLAVRERPDYSVTGKGKEDNSHICLCLNSPLFRLRCGTFVQRLLRWKCRNVLHARRRSHAGLQLRSHSTECHLTVNSSFRFSAITNPLFHTSYCTWFRPHQPHRTSPSARACASITFELTLPPTMLCIHLVYNWGEPERASH